MAGSRVAEVSIVNPQCKHLRLMKAKCASSFDGSCGAAIDRVAGNSGRDSGRWQP